MALSFVIVILRMRFWSLAIFLCYCIFAVVPMLPAQSGFILPPNRKQIDIPFDYSNGFIILNVTFNRVLPLKFIFDTGAEHTILCKREMSDLLQVPYEREFRVTGSDLSTVLVAYLARFVHLELNDQIKARQEDILVLQDDYFHFDEYAGMEVHGIISGNAFSRYFVRINYKEQIITLYDREHFRMKDNGFYELPVEVYRNKLYYNTTITISNDSVVPVKLLIDTGAALPMLLFANTHAQLHPPATAIRSNIGAGLGGFIEGFIGRTPKLSIGKTLEQHNVITYYQMLDSTGLSALTNNRNGLIGTSILNRFELILDYYEGRMWLKPNKHYKQKFVFDRSGANLIAAGPHLAHYVVQEVLPNSPAAEAGLQRGDRILRAGLKPAAFFSLSTLQRYLQGKPGKRRTLLVQRNQQQLTIRLTLRELL